MKTWKFVFALSLCLLLTACGSAPGRETPEAEFPGKTESSTTAADFEESPPSLEVDEEATVTLFRIVDGAEEGNLLLAKLCRCIGADVYRLPMGEIPVTLDGAAAEPSALKDGMVVEVSYDGTTLETYPAQFGRVYQIAGYSIGSEKNPGGTCYDLCGLYLQVLDDLWRKDPALNENITQIALDLSQAPGGLTEGEKAALVWRFGELHGAESFAATFEELKDQGCLSSEPLGEGAPEGTAFLHWEDGCFFSITPNEDHEGEVYSLPVIFFDAEKWRSSLGSYCFYDCSAVWGELTSWSGYKVGSEMIS